MEQRSYELIQYFENGEIYSQFNDGDECDRLIKYDG